MAQLVYAGRRHVSSDIVIVERDSRIAVITLNRPERLNAISRETIAHVQAAMDKLETDDEIAVIIIRGAGRAFSSGMDLKLSLIHISEPTRPY